MTDLQVTLKRAEAELAKLKGEKHTKEYIVFRNVKFKADVKTLDDYQQLKKSLKDLAEDAGLVCVAGVWKKFKPQGVTGLILLETSHVAIHTWPEDGIGYLTLASCNAEVKPDDAIKGFIKKIGAEIVEKVDETDPADPRCLGMVPTGTEGKIAVQLAKSSKVVESAREAVSLFEVWKEQVLELGEQNEGGGETVKAFLKGLPALAQAASEELTRWIAGAGVEKKLSDKEKQESEEETARIRENREKPEAQKPHKFRPAEWTHPNGHPRCSLCGGEERTGGECPGYVATKEQQEDVWATTKKVQEAAQAILPHVLGRTKFVLEDVVVWSKQLLSLQPALKATYPALRVPDPPYLIGRLKEGKIAGIMSTLPRTNRIGVDQAFVNEKKDDKFESMFAWGIVKQGESKQAGEFSDTSEYWEAVDETTRGEYDGKRDVFFLPLELIEAYDTPVDLGRIAGRRFGPEVEVKDDGPTLNVDPNILQEWPDDRLDAYRKELETFFVDARGVDREATLNAAFLLRHEWERRGISRSFKGALGEAMDMLAKMLPDGTGNTAPVNPSGEEKGEAISLEEVLRNVKPICLRNPAVALVGGVANHGHSKNDVDVLIRDPLDEETKRAIEFRLGRMFPPEISKRIQFLGDEMGGPFCLANDRVVMVKRGNELYFDTLEGWWNAWGHHSTPRIGRSGCEYLNAPDDAMTLSLKDGKSVWTSLRYITRKSYDGKLIHLRQRWGQTEVTPNHAVYNSDGSLRQPSDINELLAVRSIPTLHELDHVEIFARDEASGRWKLPRPLGRDYRESDLFDLLRMLAAYIADGHSSGTYLVISDGDLERLLEVARACQRLWGIAPCVYDRRKASDHTSRLIINRMAFANTFRDLCGGKSIDKRMPNWIFNLPSELRCLFLTEFVRNDGNVRKRGNSKRRKIERRFFTTSKILLAQLSTLQASLNQDFAIERNAWSPWTKNQGFCLAERGGCNKESRLRREERTIHDFVYDLSCEDTHNFVDGCGLVVVHNTNNVELYDLWLIPRKQFEIKEMSLDIDEADRSLLKEYAMKQILKADPLLEYPEGEIRKHESTLQMHFRGASMHGDFRAKANDHLIGYTIAFQKKGLPDVNTIPQAQALSRQFDVDGSRVNKPFRAPASVWATPKAVAPVEWLRIAPKKFEPGEVGASAEEEGVIVEVDRPMVEWGIQSPHFHEYFLTKAKSGLEGILSFRLLTGERGASEAEVEAGSATRAGEPFWTSKIGTTFLPSVLRRRAMETKSMPPDGQSAMPLSLMKITPEDHRFWNHKGAKAREVRDALVESKFFTEDNIKMVNGEFARVEMKTSMHLSKEMFDIVKLDEIPCSPREER